MTKLDEEAEEFTDSKKSFWRQGRTCIDSVKQAYIAGAEPREKRIAELEEKNAELKEQNSKAKELLTRFVMVSVYFNGNETGLITEAERFLKEIKND